MTPMTHERLVLEALVTLLMVAFFAWLVADLRWPWKALVWLYAAKWTLNLIVQHPAPTGGERE